MQDETERTAGGECRIGEWTFLPAANELRRTDGNGEGERRRLEHRAARTLELLCRRSGAIVSQEEILREVWNGRAISPNSVPVVIKDLRQALGDDAREPRHIETVAKRGYRLLSGPEEDPIDAEELAKEERPLPIVMFGAPLLLLIALLAAWWIMRPSGPPAVPLIVMEVENATGSPRWQPLASAASAVIMTNAQRMEGVQIFRGTDGRRPAGAVTLGARLIIWSGRPTVMMSAQDEAGVVIWTGMTSGEETLIPPEVSVAMGELSEKLRPEGGRQLSSAGR